MKTKSSLFKIFKTGRIIYLVILLLFIAPPTSGEVVFETENEITERVYISHYSTEKTARNGSGELTDINYTTSDLPLMISKGLSGHYDREKLFILYCTFKYYD